MRARGRPVVFVDDIGVEGYQKSDMVEAGPNGPRLRHPRPQDSRRCDTLVARVFDVGGQHGDQRFDRGPDQCGDRRVRRFRGWPTPAGRVDHGHQRGRRRDAVSIEPLPHTRAHGACGASMTRPPRRTRSARASSTRCRRDASSGARRPAQPDRTGARPRSLGISAVFPQRHEPQRGRAHPQHRR